MSEKLAETENAIQLAAKESMTEQEAIKRIEDHERAHKIGQPPHVHIGEALRMAIKALEKRTPTMVTHEATLYACHTCPSCKNVVDETTEFIPGQKIRVMAQWCKFCGQALKWE